MNNSNKIIANTVVIYGRVAITTIVILLSSRWILNALGVEDYGIYNLVAGLLAMLMVFNSSMAASTQRFLSYSIGVGEKSKITETFNLSLLFHVVIGLIIFFLIEFVGQYFLLNVLSVPIGREDAALFCLHCLSVSTCFSIFSVPFTAMLLSYENMIYMSVIQIGEAILKLVTAIVLMQYFGDRLKLYAICVTGISLVAIVLYVICCAVKYECCRIQLAKIQDRSFLKKYSSFAMWSLIGSVSTMLKNQGVAMLLNSFYGVIINAAYGIASQIKGQLMFISTSIVTAARPQIVQSEGRGDRERVFTLSSSACKFSFLLLSFISVPFIVEMSLILNLWLGTVPKYAVVFSILIIITNLIFQFSVGAFLPFESVGKIKLVQLITGLCHCLVIPVGYVLLRLGCRPETLLMAVLVEEFISVFVIIALSRKATGLDARKFIFRTIIPPLFVVAVSTGLAYVVHVVIVNQWIRLFSVIFVSTVCLSLFSYFYALEDYERNRIKSIFTKLKK